MTPVMCRPNFSVYTHWWRQLAQDRGGVRTIQHQYLAKSLGLKYADILHAPLVQVKEPLHVY